MEWWHWWLVVNLICWVGGWAILQTVLIEVFARLIDSCCLIVVLVWAIALLLAIALVVALPELFVLPVWLVWLREGREL
jgi:hypothetical protein